MIDVEKSTKMKLDVSITLMIYTYIRPSLLTKTSFQDGQLASLRKTSNAALVKIGNNLKRLQDKVEDYKKVADEEASRQSSTAATQAQPQQETNIDAAQTGIPQDVNERSFYLSASSSESDFSGA